MAIEDDFSIALNGDIRWTGTSGQYSVEELHRFVQDNADNAVASSADDLINITSPNPSDRATDQIITLLGTYNIDDTAAQHLFGGSIRQGSGATEELYSGLQVVGSVGDAATELQVIQNHTILTNYWGTGLNVNPGANILNRILVKSRTEGRDIDGKRIRVQAREFGDTYAEFLVTLGDGESVAAIFTGTDLNNDTAVGTVATYNQHTNTEGYQLLDISGDGTDEDYYSQWTITGGGSIPATPTLKSLYEYTKYVQRRGTAETIHGMNGELFRGVTHSIDYDSESAAFTEDETLCWGTTMAYDNGVGTPFTIGEKLSFGTSGAVGTLLKGGTGATGEMVVAIEPGTGTVVDGEQITGATSGATADVDGITRLDDTGATGGRGVLLALDDNGVDGVFYIQLISGAAPTDNLPIHGISSDSEALVNVTVDQKTVSPEFIGTFTGSSLIGAYGIGMDPTDTTAADLFFPLDDATYPTGVTPPNNVTFDVNGVVVGEDRILVGPNSAGSFNKTQMTLQTTLSAAGVTSIQMSASTPDNTPATGTIRVIDDNGNEKFLSYTGITTTTNPDDTFTGVASGPGTTNENDFNVVNATAGNGAYVTYIDKLAASDPESFTTVFDSAQTLRVRVRDGGLTPIKEFEGTASLGSSGGAANVNRISDE